MRTRQLAFLVPVLALLLAPGHAAAVVVVRARPVAAVAVVAVATRPVYVAPAPVYYAPPPTTVVVTAPPAPQPPPSTEKLPVDTTVWTLPSGCLKVSVGGQELFQCGPNYFKAYPNEKGTYYAVVAPP